MKMQKGFTLIELIAVIVILGILAAVALPKFAGLDTEAKNAVLDGAAAAAMSAAQICYAKTKAVCDIDTFTGTTYLTLDPKVSVKSGATCATFTLVYDGTLEKNYSIPTDVCTGTKT